MEVVTRAAIQKAADACEDLAGAREEMNEAETAKTIAIMKVFQRLLGIKSEVELKDLSPEHLRKIAKRRVESGEVKLSGVTLDKLLDHCIQISQVRRNVAWKEHFLVNMGEAKAAEILQNTQESYSYRIIRP